MRPNGDSYIGLTFGRLLVLAEVRKKPGRALWHCRCACGAHKFISREHVRSGRTRSCGCLLRESRRNRARHGHARTHTSEYQTWVSMRQRCANPRAPGYDNYGGRGISVCQRWLKSFENFIADMGLKPSPKHSIDRINNDGNYEPGNCRWATRREQSNNKRVSRRLTIGGETLTVAEWAARTGLDVRMLHGRLQRGWRAEDVVSSEKRKGKTIGEKQPRSKLTEDSVRELRRLRMEENVSFPELARRFGINESTAQNIVYRKLWKHVDAPNVEPSRAEMREQVAALLSGGGKS